MKLLILSSVNPYPPTDGVKIKLYYLIKHLARRGHNISIFFLQKSSASPKSSLNELSKYCELIKSIPIQFKSFTRLLYWLQYLPKILEKNIYSYIKLGDVDIIHCDTFLMACSMSRLISTLPVPSIASINDSFSLGVRDGMLFMPTFSKTKWSYVFQYPFIKRYESKLYEKFQKIHVVSNVDNTYLKALNPHLDVETIPNGVDVNFYKPLGLQQEDLSLAYHGDMDGKSPYALWFIKKVFYEVKKEIPKVKFFLIGKNPRKELIKTATKTENVVLTGYVNDVRPYLDKATLAVSPDKKTCGILNHVLEAMAMEKTVVGTWMSFLGIPGSKSMENVVMAYDENDFIYKIIYLLENENERKRIGRNARKLIESKYTWEKIIPKYESMYKDAIIKFNCNTRV
jgi:glycosyltransferase involved in cell wall biosynthesis